MTATIMATMGTTMPVSVPLEIPLDLLEAGEVVGDEGDVDAAPGAGRR